VAELFVTFKIEKYVTSKNIIENVFTVSYRLSNLSRHPKISLVRSLTIDMRSSFIEALKNILIHISL
jgi:hypothetical protein